MPRRLSGFAAIHLQRNPHVAVRHFTTMLAVDVGVVVRVWRRNMCELPATDGRIARRGVLKFAATAVASLAVPHHALASVAGPPEPGNVVSPDAALDRLMQGNDRYVE